ncbi:MAG: MOSC domain-containing protein [Hyphomicrobium sp.]
MSNASPNAVVAALYRYPIKGMTGEPLARVALATGETLPFDRAYAIENGPGAFDPAAPKHLPKINFLMLMRHEELAKLRVAFDDQTHSLVLSRDGADIARGDLRTAEGRSGIESALAAHVKTGMRGAPKIVASEGLSFTDAAVKCLHIVNLESVRALEEKMGVRINPLRFRPNVILDELPAWSEFDLVEKRVNIGDAALDVFERTVRCTATNVDPETGARDLKIPSFLSKTYGHTDFGVYARVVLGGELSIGDRLAL